MPMKHATRQVAHLWDAQEFVIFLENIWDSLLGRIREMVSKVEGLWRFVRHDGGINLFLLTEDISEGVEWRAT